MTDQATAAKLCYGINEMGQPADGLLPHLGRLISSITVRAEDGGSIIGPVKGGSEVAP